LRLAAKPPDPVGFQRRNDPAGWDSDGLGALPVAFDPHLFWRGAASHETPPEDDAAVVMVLADGSARDPRHGRPWPERLERLIDLNEAPRPIVVLNASQPGYSSFQSRRWLERFAGRPELVIAGIGASDSHPVRIPDLEYARRLERLGGLTRSWLALRAAHWLWASTAPQAAQPRVGAEETRANLGAIVARVRGWDGQVALLDNRSVAPSDGAAPLPLDGVVPDVARIRVDADGRPPAEAVAAAVLDFLRRQGLVLTSRRHPAEADTGARHGWPALDQGFGPVEPGPQGIPGRWIQAEAALGLERASGEAGVALEVTCPTRSEATLEANGVRLGGLGGCLGRRWYRFSLESVPDDFIQLRLTTPQAGRLFVHGVRLTPSGDPLEHGADPLYASELELEDAADARPELGPGWGPREVWSDGRRGRWTGREASLYLERRGAENGLLLEATLENPDNATTCRIEVNDVPVYEFTSANGRHRYGVDIEPVAGRRLRVRLVVERTFVPRAGGDRRSLGLFVHNVRLARSALP
jgi:hypothetical protein